MVGEKPTAGKFVWACVISEKSSQAKGYKRILGKLQDPRLVLATIIAIFKHIRVNYPKVHGIIFEVPSKIFVEMRGRLQNLVRLLLKKEYNVPDVVYNDEETEILGLFGIPIVAKQYQYKSVFIIGSEVPKSSEVPKNKRL